MPASLLEVLRTIPDRRRDEGKRFDLATIGVPSRCVSQTRQAQTTAPVHSAYRFTTLFTKF